MVSTSAGQVKAMLVHGRLHGLIEPLPLACAAAAAGGDSRTRPLQPTMTAWVAGFLRAMQGVPALELPAISQQLLRTLGLVPEMFAYRMAALQIDCFVLFEGPPLLRWVLAHGGGYRVYLHLLSVAEAQADGSALARVTPAALAQRAVISRGTVRNLMASAAGLGWQADGRGGWRASAQALDTARHWVTPELAWMHGLVCAAWEALRRHPRAAQHAAPGGVGISKPVGKARPGRSTAALPPARERHEPVHALGTGHRVAVEHLRRVGALQQLLHRQLHLLARQRARDRADLEDLLGHGLLP